MTPTTRPTRVEPSALKHAANRLRSPRAAVEMQLPAPPDRDVRLGLIGVGGIATNAHLPAIASLRRRGWPIQVSAMCDIDPARLAAAGRLCPDAAAYTDADAMIRQADVDAWIIMTWPPLTASLVETAIERGLPMLVEKPVSHDQHVLERLADRAAARGAAVQVAYNRLHQPLAEAFRQKAAAIGSPRHVEARLWRARRDEPLFYEDVMVHPISALRVWFGPLTVDDVTDWPAGATGGLPAGRRARMHADRATIHLDIRPAVGQYVESIEVLGDGGSVSLHCSTSSRYGEDARLIEHRDGEDRVLAHLSRERETGVYARGFVNQIAAFCQLVTQPDAAPICDLRLAADIWRVAHGIQHDAVAL